MLEAREYGFLGANKITTKNIDFSMASKQFNIRHNENSRIASYYRQFSMNNKTKIITLIPVLVARAFRFKKLILFL